MPVRDRRENPHPWDGHKSPIGHGGGATVYDPAQPVEDPFGQVSAALDAFEVGFARIDATGRVAEVNRALEALAGSTSEALLGRPWVELVAHGAAGDALAAADGALAVRVALVPPPAGWPEGTLALVQRDSARESLTEAEWLDRQFLQTLLGHLQVMVVACDGQGRVTLTRQLQEQVQYVPQEDLSLESWLGRFEFYEPDGRTTLPSEEAPLARAFRGEVVRDFEYAVLDRDGNLRHRRASGEALYGPSGDKLGAVVALLDITDQRRAEEALRQQALTDPLTGLPNRALLLDHLNRALSRPFRHRGDMAVLFLDLDHFKVLNDGLGHSAGDVLLVEVARRLSTALRPGDVLARLGGDEFVVFCEDLEDASEAEAVAHRLRAAIASQVIIEGRDVRATASIGIARRMGPRDTAEGMLRDADTAMYLAKDLGRDRHEVFGEALRARAVRRMEAQRSLERAVEEGRLRVYYQPIVLAATGRLVGVEALARYEDPEHGVVSPVEFVPIAEATGMIARIDAWVLDRSLAQLRAWGEAHPKARPYVACNLSGRTLARGDLDTLVDEALARHGLAAERLCLEMTESTLITATAELRAQLLRIRHRGTRLGLDDFGTGYSSLTYLRELPVSFLKIDRSFVRDLATDPGARAIVEAVVRLAHALGLTVTAEGVEEDAHPELLRAIGCDQLQGYYYSRPVPPEGLTALLRQAVD